MGERELLLSAAHGANPKTSQAGDIRAGVLASARGACLADEQPLLLISLSINQLAVALLRERDKGREIESCCIDRTVVLSPIERAFDPGGGLDVFSNRVTDRSEPFSLRGTLIREHYFSFQNLETKIATHRYCRPVRLCPEFLDIRSGHRGSKK